MNVLITNKAIQLKQYGLSYECSDTDVRSEGLKTKLMLLYKKKCMYN